MSLRNLARTIVLAGLGTLYGPAAMAETAPDLAEPPVKAAPARSHREDTPHAAGSVDQAFRASRTWCDGRKATRVAQPLSAARQSPKATGRQPRAAVPHGSVKEADKRPAGKPDPRLTSGRAESEASLPDDAQDELIREILGIAETRAMTKPVPSKVGSAIFKCVSLQPETSAKPPSTAPRRQNGYGSMFGRIMRVDVDTNTVDIQFEGSRQTTVGSKFSVEHDYAFTTEYLGKIEIVYLAGGNRAIAKPGQGTDITKMGKGDRVGGRIVPNKKAANGTGQSGTDGSSNAGGAAGADGSQSDGGSSGAPSCVKPPVDKLPLPPPDPAIPYAPDATVPEEPGPAPGITRPEQKGDSLATYRSVRSHEASHALAKPVQQKASVAVAGHRSAQSAIKPVPPNRPFIKPTSVIHKSSQQLTRSPLKVPVKSSGCTHLAPREKWSAITAQTWDALLRPNRNSPGTVSMTRQSAKTATVAGSSAKSLWCALKPKPAAPEQVRTASLPSLPKQTPTILLFESE